MNIRKANISDLDGICSLMKEENDGNVSNEYLENWYWKNPFKSHSLIICEENGKTLGISSTNNFKMNIHGTEKLIAFPQKVLTSNEIRGKGFFSKLYFENEKDNIDNQKVDHFLTFTNEMSTPIFLDKFGYKRGISPSITILPTLPRFQRADPKRMREVNELDDKYLSDKDLIQRPESIIKDRKYYDWRYGQELNGTDKSFIKLEIFNEDLILGYAILKKVVRMKLPFFYLTEIITHSKDYIPDIIRSARCYSSSKGAFGLMLINNYMTDNSIDNYSFKLTIKNRLNFLVKGKSQIETEELAITSFNFSFGDLDFI